VCLQCRECVSTVSRVCVYSVESVCLQCRECVSVESLQENVDDEEACDYKSWKSNLTICTSNHIVIMCVCALLMTWLLFINSTEKWNLTKCMNAYDVIMCVCSVDDEACNIHGHVTYTHHAHTRKIKPSQRHKWAWFHPVRRLLITRLVILSTK
jgi:hypothetical protein